MLWLEIPAYAGSTRTSPTGSARSRDHPRIRGEHTIDDRRRILTNGSSPHTRGALIIFRSIAAFEGIIPAGVHRHIDAFIDVEKHFSLPWRDFHGRVDRYGGA